METQIRPIEPGDYDATAALLNSAEPERRWQAARWRQADARAGDDRTVRYVAVAGAPPQIVGYGAFWRVRLNKYRLELLVAPGRRRQGLGGRLMRQLLDGLALRGAATVQARTSEDDLESLTFLWGKGFVETQRMYRLRLAVGAASVEPWRLAEPRLAAQGIAIGTLAYERAHEPACLHKLYELHLAALPDWPDPDPSPPAQPAFAEYARRFERDEIMPEGFFIAKQGERYVGYSGLAADPASAGVLIAAGTAVHPAWRGRGIGMALKLRTVLFAQQQGYGTVIAHTANPTMLAINVRLGFRRERAEVRLVLAL